MSGNKMTIAKIKKLNRSIEVPVPVATSRNLSVADHGKILDVTAALTLTLPQDMPVGFRCAFIAPSGVNLTIARAGTMTLNGAGTSLTRARAGNPALVDLVVRAANTALVSGA
jgi:hypothetical protein